MRKYIFAFVLLPTLLAACVSGYQQFYRPSPWATPEKVASSRAAPAPKTPLVERARPLGGGALLKAYARRGYAMIGQSTFNSGQPQPVSFAIEQGKAVGADLVLILDPTYTGSESTVVPITTPTSTSSYSTGTATAYGSGGSVTAYGTSNTTTYGTSTAYVPVTIRRFNYGALYFVKTRVVLGAFFRDLNDTERQQLQSNKGVFVTVVVDGTPAFTADILAGDIIVSVNDVRVVDSKQLHDLLKENKGKQVRITLYRNGKQIEKVVHLNP